MLLPGRNLDSFAFLKNEDVIFDLHRQFAFENIEELAGADMRMAHLAGPGRHELFDNTEVRSLNQVPSVAVSPLRTAPFIMFGGFDADDRWRHV